MKTLFGAVLVAFCALGNPCSAGESAPGAQIPVDNCDKEITNGLTACKPPVSITMLRPEQLATFHVPTGCLLNGHVLTCYR